MFQLSGLTSLVFILFLIVGKSLVKGGAHLKIFALEEAFIREGRSFEEIRSVVISKIFNNGGSRCNYAHILGVA